MHVQAHPRARRVPHDLKSVAWLRRLPRNRSAASAVRPPLRGREARTPTAQSERRWCPGLSMRRRMARAARPRRPQGRSDRAAAMLVSAAANPISGRLLKPSESKMEVWPQMRFYRVCGHTSYILQLEERPWPVSTRKCARGTVGRGAATPTNRPGTARNAIRKVDNLSLNGAKFSGNLPIGEGIFSGHQVKGERCSR